MDKATAKQAIRMAVVDAMETTDVPDITVMQVCKASGVARSSFYRYYDSVDQVVKEMGNDLLASIRRINELDARESRRGGSGVAIRQTDLARAQVIEEYAPFIRAVNGIHGDPSFSAKAAVVLKESFEESNVVLLARVKNKELLVEFFAAGVYNLINYWVKYHPEMTAEEFYGAIGEMFDSLIAVIEKSRKG